MSVYPTQEDSDKIKKIKRQEVLHDPGLKHKTYLGVFEENDARRPVLIRDFETPGDEFFRNIRIDEALKSMPSSRLRPLVAGITSFQSTTLAHDHDGISLSELIARPRPRDAELTEIAKELVNLVADAHERGILLGRSIVEGCLINLQTCSAAMICYDYAGFFFEESDFDRFKQSYQLLFEVGLSSRNDLFQVDYYYLGEAICLLVFGKVIDGVAALEAELMEHPVSAPLATSCHYLLSRSVPHFFSGTNQILDLLNDVQQHVAVNSKLSFSSAAYNYLANDMMARVNKLATRDSISVIRLSAAEDYAFDEFILSLKQHPQFQVGSGYTLYHYAFERYSNGQEHASLFVMFKHLLSSLGVHYEADFSLEQLLKLFLNYCATHNRTPFLYLTFADCLPTSELDDLAFVLQSYRAMSAVIVLHSQSEPGLISNIASALDISLPAISLSSVNSILSALFNGKNEVEFIPLAKWLVKESGGSIDLMGRLFLALKQADHLNVDSVGTLRWNQFQVEQFNYAQWREGYIFSLCGLDKKEDILTLCALAVAPKPLTEKQLTVMLEQPLNLIKLVSLGMVRPTRLGLETHYLMRDEATSQYFRSKYKIMCAGYSLALMRDFYAEYIKNSTKQMAVCLARQLLFHQLHLKPLAQEHTLEPHKRKFSTLAFEAAHILANAGMQQEAVALASTLLKWLNDSDWKQQYSLCAEIVTMYASWHSYCESFDEPLVQDQLKQLFNADAARVLEYLISYHKTAARHDKAVECAIKALDLLGLQIGKITLTSLTGAFVEAYLTLLLSPPEKLLDRPVATDKRPGQILSIMWLMVSSTYMFNPLLLGFLVLKSIPLILKADILPYTPNVLTAFGVILVNRLGDHKVGDRLYQISRALIEKHNMRDSIAPVEFYYWAMIAPWSKPLDEVIFNLQNAYLQARQTGDYEHASYISGAYFGTALMRGNGLLDLRRQLANRMPEIIAYKQSTPMRVHQSLQDFYNSITSLKINKQLLHDEPTWVQEANLFDRTALFTYRSIQTVHSSLLGNPLKTAQAYECTVALRDSAEGLPYSSLVDLLALPALRSARFGTRWASLLRILFAARKASKQNRSVFYSKYQAALGELANRFKFFGLAKRFWTAAYQHAIATDTYLDAAVVAEMLANSAKNVDGSLEWLKLAAQAYANADATAKVAALAESNPALDTSIGLDADFLTRVSQCADMASVISICTSELCFNYAGIWTISGNKVAVSDETINFTDTRLSTLYRQALVVEEYENGIFIMLRLETQQHIEGALIVSTESNINVDRYLSFLNLLARVASAFLHAAVLRNEVDRLNYDRQALLRYQTALGAEVSGPMELVQTVLGQVMHNSIPDKRTMSLANAATADVVDIVNEVTDIEQFKHNQIRLSPSFVNLFEELDALANQFSLKAAQKSLRFQFYNDIPEHWSVFVDRRRIRQVVKNLLKNALQYTERGSVTVHLNLGKKLTSTRAEFIIVIEDSGSGMTGEEQRRYFSSYSSELSLSSQKLSNSGLYFTQALVKLLGGNITVNSTADVGTAITLMLPLEYRQAELDWMPEFPVHVLLINDDPLFAMRAVQSLLEQAGCAVETATTFDELKTRDFANINMAIIDLDLGTSINAAQIRKLIQASGFSGVLVMLTAEDDRFTELSAQSEFDYVFKKPFTMDSVKILMRSFVRKTQSLH